MIATSLHQTYDLNVERFQELPAPNDLRREIAAPAESLDYIASVREEIHRIIFGNDDRLLLVVGPCSIHDVGQGLAYAHKLKVLADEVADSVRIVMRVYFEKPRTTVGWKGLIMDPHLDESGNIPAGLRLAREILRDVLQLGLPTATEFLDPITPQYIADLICWAAIGARTAESQPHRQMASGLSMPVGIKNTTSGDVEPAINAIRAACQKQTFLGVDGSGRACAVTTRGNPNGHIILRGGNKGPNFSLNDVLDTREKLLKAGLLPAVMVDCSHDNSGKKAELQPEVLHQVVDDIVKYESPVIGAMIESNLLAGKQAFPQPLDQLKAGLSITDACLGWEDTEKLVLDVAEKLRRRKKS